MMVATSVLREMGYNLAWFYNWKRKNLWAECSVKYFLWFLRNHFLFSIQSCPWAWQLGIHLLLYWISDVHFLLTLDVFTTANRVLHTCPQPLVLALAPFPLPFILLSVPAWTLADFCTPQPQMQHFDHIESSLFLEHDILLASVLSHVLFLLPGRLFRHYDWLSLCLSFF